MDSTEAALAVVQAAVVIGVILVSLLFVVYYLIL
jgi:hypothetical protein